MSNEIDFLYIGWQHDTNRMSGVKHDKVWTAFKTGDCYYAGWGKRDKAVSFKKHDSLESIEKAIRQKKKNYNEVDAFQLFTLFPYFKDEVAQRLTYCVLANKLR
jgi:hypothetical protein